MLRRLIVPGEQGERDIPATACLRNAFDPIGLIPGAAETAHHDKPRAGSLNRREIDRHVVWKDIRLRCRLGTYLQAAAGRGDGQAPCRPLIKTISPGV